MTLAAITVEAFKALESSLQAELGSPPGEAVLWVAVTAEGLALVDPESAPSQGLALADLLPPGAVEASNPVIDVAATESLRAEVAGWRNGEAIEGSEAKGSGPSGNPDLQG